MENKPKVLGFMPIHYGREYLAESLKSVAPFVDIMHVAYSKKPSHSFGTTESCPDNEEDILKICSEIFGDRLIWDRAESYSHEAYHRDRRYVHSKGYDLILSIDADEVFAGVPKALKYAMEHEQRYYGIDGYINFWRNFEWCNTDGFRPIRIEKVGAPNQLQNLGCPMTVYHFSTCQREEVMRYKNKVFGHASEIRQNWFEEVYLAWDPKINLPHKLHPVSLDIWGCAEPFDKTTLPENLKNHPNYNKEKI
jgi:hypothetical protein